MDPISIAFGLAKVAPIIAGWLGGDDAEKTTAVVIDAAKRVTGIIDPEDALTQIQNNPELQIKFQQAMNPIIIAKLENQTKQLIAVNATMQAEFKSNDPFVRRWRPFYGYAVAMSWAVQMIGFTLMFVWVAVKHPTELATVVQQFALLSGALISLWGIALAVLGVNIGKRSDDKALAAGHPPNKGIIKSLTQRWLGDNKGAS